MIVNIADSSPKDVHKLLIGAVVPRPIAWVSSISADGVPNLAPFSYFTIASSDPPRLLFCPVARADGSPKDTLRNIAHTGECVIHLVGETLAEAMNQTSGDYPYGSSEFEQIALPTTFSHRVTPPRLEAAPVAFECEVEKIVQLDAGTAVVIVRVLLAHIHDDVYRDGYIALDALQPIARLAGNDYARITETFALKRPRIDRETGQTLQ